MDYKYLIGKRYSIKWLDSDETDVIIIANKADASNNLYSHAAPLVELLAHMQEGDQGDINGQRFEIIDIGDIDDTQEIVELRKFFQKHVVFNGKPFVLDRDQLKAVLSDGNTLATARAGSGKTRVLIAKLIYLFEKQGLTDRNIFTFCFNRDARKVINDRLRDGCLIDGEPKYKDYEAGSTFHAFAKRVAGFTGNILDDRASLIKRIIDEIKKEDKGFEEAIYNLFRAEALRVDRKNFRSPETYYNYMRNATYNTLNGERVKSEGEKIIADFLFEHDIKYYYEWNFNLRSVSLDYACLPIDKQNEYGKLLKQKNTTVPDFYLPDYNAIWEHWAVCGNETEEEKREFNENVGNYYEYLENRSWKQRLWSGDWRQCLSNYRPNQRFKSIELFIETDYKGFMRDGREAAEKKIEALLKAKGIECKKLPQEELWRRAWEKAKDDFTRLIDQFIRVLQQNYFIDPQSFVKTIETTKDRRTKKFYEIGMCVYRRYVEILSSRKNEGEFFEYNNFDCDFNQLMCRAAEAIRAGKLDKELTDIKWILIDEYQDFSKLFNYLIESILERNPDIKLLCVGDDWQAINRFAGSDLVYFNNFKEKYGGLDIRSNYRCEKHIVDFANAFMGRNGFDEGHPVPRRQLESKGVSGQYDVTSVSVGNREEGNVYYDYATRYGYRPKLLLAAQYLKLCLDIIEKHKEQHILILNRSNTFLANNLKSFASMLSAACNKTYGEDYFKQFIRVQTVHSSKGDEAETVILLNVNKGAFPVFNSNSTLFEAFGQTAENIAEDEMRLFYVALTRAKHNLYVICEQDKRSSFLVGNISRWYA